MENKNINGISADDEILHNKFGVKIEMKNFVCAECGKKFKSKNIRKYCSEECVKNAAKKRYRIKKEEQKRKNEELRKKHQALLNNYKHKIYKRKCLYCEDRFDTKDIRKRFCSEECEDEYKEAKKIYEELRKRKTKKIEDEEVEYINKFILAPTGYETEIKKGKFKFYNGKINKNMDLYYRHMFIDREPTMLRKLSESSMSDAELNHYYNIKEIQIYKKV